MSDKKYSNLHPKNKKVENMVKPIQIFPDLGISGGASKPIQKHIFKNNKNPKKEIIIKTSSENKARKIFKEKYSGKGIHVYAGIRRGKN